MRSEARIDRQLLESAPRIRPGGPQSSGKVTPAARSAARPASSGRATTASPARICAALGLVPGSRHSRQRWDAAAVVFQQVPSRADRARRTPNRRPSRRASASSPRCLVCHHRRIDCCHLEYGDRHARRPRPRRDELNSPSARAANDPKPERRDAASATRVPRAGTTSTRRRQAMSEQSTFLCDGAWGMQLERRPAGGPSSRS